MYDAPHDYDPVKVLTFDMRARYFVFWALPVEIGYYFLIPAFVVEICWLGRRWWLLALPFYCWVMYEGVTTYQVSFMPLRPHLSTFVAGFLAAVVYGQLSTSLAALKDPCGATLRG